jgi:HSP20 family protein
VNADTPGLTASDIKVQLTDDHTLRISGERKRDHEEKTDKYHRIERSHGRFTRSFALPENADVSKINATVDHGVCRVTIAKRAEARPKVLNVPVMSASSGGQ